MTFLPNSRRRQARQPERVSPQISARRIGHEGEPLVIVDNFAPDPQALRSHAAASTFAPAGDHYPGIRAALPPTYLAEARDALSVVFRDAFGATGRVRVLDARFALVTAAAADLTLAQRLPHVDATAPGRLAMVHYLGAQALGGTAFYRHRSTGFETISPARSTPYFAALSQETALQSPQGYLSGDTPLFESIAEVDAVFNRAVFYRSHLLHCGAVPPSAALTADPTHGRLTVTAFFAAD
jgi:hypothetical protein